MNLLYNGEFFQEDEFCLPVTNRAFQFNDGFFETIMILDGRIRFWPDHLERMLTAAETLHLELPVALLQPDAAELLVRLAVTNNAQACGRLKLRIWRKGAGLYTPEGKAADWLTTVHPAEIPAATLGKVGICSVIRNTYSPFSAFKGPFSLQYVMAGNEKKARGFDDLIILDKQDLVSELTSSNIFWCRQNILFTPSLEAGCINGIMRRNILRWSKAAGLKTREVFFDVDNLLQADVVFAANVTGIRVIRNIIGFDLQDENDIVAMLQQKLQQA